VQALFTVVPTIFNFIFSIETDNVNYKYMVTS